jgi:hypothetical protein
MMKTKSSESFVLQCVSMYIIIFYVYTGSRPESIRTIDYSKKGHQSCVDSTPYSEELGHTEVLIRSVLESVHHCKVCSNHPLNK